ncbi:MAG: AAA family ATPase [Alphaproteobacteria bacterium]
MSDRQIVLVFGLPAVGKTTLIGGFISHNPAWFRISGGDLIKQGMSEADRDSLRVQGIGQVEENQIVLINNFHKTLVNTPNKNILFDGHCLVNTGGKLYTIPTHVIQSISPNKIILLDADTPIIIARRLQDKLRPNREKETEEEVNKRRMLSMNVCQTYGKELDIPVIVLTNPSPEEFAFHLSQSPSLDL